MRNLCRYGRDFLSLIAFLRFETVKLSRKHNKSAENAIELRFILIRGRFDKRNIKLRFDNAKSTNRAARVKTSVYSAFL